MMENNDNIIIHVSKSLLEQIHQELGMPIEENRNIDAILAALLEKYRLQKRALKHIISVMGVVTTAKPAIDVEKTQNLLLNEVLKPIQKAAEQIELINALRDLLVHTFEVNTGDVQDAESKSN
jgi:hypothetical protein